MLYQSLSILCRIPYDWKYFQYTFLVIMSQTLKIAFDFFKKRSADSNSSSKSIFCWNFQIRTASRKVTLISICTVKRFLKVNLPFHASFSCKKRFFNIFQIAIESYLITVSDWNFQHKDIFWRGIQIWNPFLTKRRRKFLWRQYEKGVLFFRSTSIHWINVSVKYLQVKIDRIFSHSYNYC